MRNKDVEKLAAQMGMPWEGEDGEEVKLEVFPNRPDWLSVEGIARSMRGYLGKETGMKEYKATSGKGIVEIDKSTKNVRPFITCAVVRGVKFTDELIESVMQFQEKVHITHCRKRKKASIGIYDLDRVTFPLKYTTVDPKKFKFVPLEESKEMTCQDIIEKHPKGVAFADLLTPYKKWPILQDKKGKVLSLPPIINSEDTKVTEKTKDLFIDVTGEDERTINQVLNIITCALSDMGAKVETVTVKYSDSKDETPNLAHKPMDIDCDYIRQITGFDSSDKEIGKLLEKMRFGIGKQTNKGKLTVFIPPYRTDIMHPMDIAEDVAIAYGYENVEAKLPAVVTVGQEESLNKGSNLLRQTCIGYGYQEAMTYVLTNPEDAFDRMQLERRPAVEIEYSASSEFTIAREWLLPSMLKTLLINKHREYPQKLFEIGDTLVLDDAIREKCRTIRRLCMASAHPSADYTEMKAILSTLMDALRLEYSVNEMDHPSFMPGRCAEVIVDGKSIGMIGEVHPQCLTSWEIEVPVCALELDIEPLLR